MRQPLDDVVPGQGGLTVILIPRQEGVTTKPIKASYSPSAGTAFVTFDNVRVPVENTLGPEDGGIFVVLSNFNHERWVVICAFTRAQRIAWSRKNASSGFHRGRHLESLSAPRRSSVPNGRRCSRAQKPYKLGLRTSRTKCAIW
jgi:hypothetical protein